MIARTTRILLWIASSLAVVGFVVLAGVRLREAHPVQPSEVVLLEHAHRLLHGEPLYRPPVNPFDVPIMPGLPVAASGLMYLFGEGLWAPRLLTMLAALVVGALALLIVRAETRSGILGMVSAGILLAGLSVFALREGPASPEPLAIALGLGGLCVIRFASGMTSVVIASALLSLAFFVHPLATALFVAAGCSLAQQHRRHFLVFLVATAVFFGGGYVLLSQHLGAWFNFNAWDGPLSSLRFRPLLLLHAIGDELLGRLGVLTLSALMAFALPVRPWRGPTGLWMWTALAVVATALLSTQSLRISPQDLAPALVVLAIVGPISAQRVTQHLSAWPGSNRLGGQGVVLVALCLQFVMLLAGASAALLPPPV